MAKKRSEVNAKDRFLKFLRESRSEQWEVLNEDHVVDKKKNLNFDYQLGFQKKRIALEICYLTDRSSDIGGQKSRRDIQDYLTNELSSRSLGGYWGSSPLSVHEPKSPAAKMKSRQDLANRIGDVIRQNPNETQIQIGGFTLTKCDSLNSPVFGAARGSPGYFRSREAVALEALKKLLPRKNCQLAISGHERIVFVLQEAAFVCAADVAKACKRMNFDLLSNIDKVYFAPVNGEIALVYERPNLAHTFRQSDRTQQSP